MASFSAIRTGLKSNLNTISGLNAYDTIPSNPAPPWAVVGGPSGKEFQIDYSKKSPPGTSWWILPVWVGVSALDGESAQDELDPYLSSTGSTSIKLALEGALGSGSATLGGIAHYVTVAKVENYTGNWCEFRVEVLA